MKRKILMMMFGMVLMVISVFAYTTLVEVRYNNQDKDFMEIWCEDNSISLGSECLIQYTKRNMATDYLTDTQEDMNRMYDEGMQNPMFARLLIYHATELWKDTRSNSEWIIYECIGNSVEETDKQLCLYLTDLDKTCVQSMDSFLTMPCPIPWVQV